MSQDKPAEKKADKPKEEKKAEKPKEEKKPAAAAEDDDEDELTKEEKIKVPLDNLPPSPFDLDQFKRCARHLPFLFVWPR